jgi:hypothetical protein
MPGVGRRVIGQVGTTLQLAAGVPLRWLVGGATIDWTTVAAVSGSDYTIPAENTVVKVGNQFLRYGQVMTRISNPTVQTITVTGTPTGGTFNLVGIRPDSGATTTATIAFNAAVAATQTAMDAIFGAGNTVVTGAGALPGNVHTVTFQASLQYITIPALVADASALTGGTAPGVTVAVTTAGGNTGKWGPYDFAATDGRQTLTRGNVGLINRTILPAGVNNLYALRDTDHTGLLVGGPVFRGRLIATAGTHSLANGPTFTELEAVLPLLEYVRN